MSKTFEIIGVHPANKGALLMLEAIKQRLSIDFPDARFATPMSWSYESRMSCGVWSTSGEALGRPKLASMLDRAPRKYTDQVGFVRSRDVDVLLDASGFGYGDFWGLEKLESRLVQRLRRWKTGSNRTAIMLPQALGPFEKPGMAAAFSEATKYLDIAYVRDAASQQFVLGTIGSSQKIKRSPDFTNLLKVELPQRLRHLQGCALIIPNEKMIEGKTAAGRENYIAFLRYAVERLASLGREVLVLVHERAQDKEIARELGAGLKSQIRTVDEPSALVTKAIISASSLVVSSRFHGLVSALSSAVPSLASGWSHKYLELMSDYECADMMVDLAKPEEWPDKLDLLITRGGSSEFRQQLTRSGTSERSKTEQMWNEVIGVINGNRA